MVEPVTTAALISAGSSLLNNLFGATGNRNTSTQTGSSFDSVGSTITGQDSNQSRTGTRRGSTTAGARTTTRTGTTNQAAIDATVRSLMEGPQGLASIMGAEQGSGGFGSSNAALMTNDLISRIGGEVGKLTQGSVEEQGAQTTESDDTSADNSISSQLTRAFTAASGNQQGFSDTQGGGKKGLCFITAAACEVMGLDDDCDALTTLRGFRDDWMMKNHPDMVALYYAEGEGIVSYINSREDAHKLFKIIYWSVIDHCADCVRYEEYDEAYQRYVEAIVYLMAAKKVNA